MDNHTYDNWVKVKETFEESGNTDNMFYKRACDIVKSRQDPMQKYLEFPNKESGEETEE